MSDSSITIETSKRRFLKALLAGGVIIGAGVLGYEFGVTSIRCPPCPSTTTTGTVTSVLSCPNLPYGYDYVIYTSNGNYYVVDPSRGQT